MNPPLVIAILGLPRSGSSCISGILERLGVPMGKSWIRPQRGNPKGYYEDRLMLPIREACGNQVRRWKHPRRNIPSEKVVQMLLEWREKRSIDGPIVGGKLPFLLHIVPELERAFSGQWKAIVPDRPIQDSARSAADAPIWRRRRIGAKGIFPLFVKGVRQQNIALEQITVPRLRIWFADMMRDPALTVTQLVAFCGLSPSVEQLQAALNFVDPSLNHFSR
jgi:hypothetical protein